MLSTADVISDVIATSSVDDLLGGKTAARIEGQLKTAGIIPPPPKVDVAEALASLARVVAKKGISYVYPDAERSVTGSCQYTVAGKPSCIVGHVLADLGKLGGRVVDMNKSADALADGSDGSGNGFTRGAARLLRAAQVEQDSHKTWGQALAAAYLSSQDVAFEPSSYATPAEPATPSAYLTYGGPVPSYLKYTPPVF